MAGGLGNKSVPWWLKTKLRDFAAAGLHFLHDAGASLESECGRASKWLGSEKRREGLEEPLRLSTRSRWQ